MVLILFNDSIDVFNNILALFNSGIDIIQEQYWYYSTVELMLFINSTDFIQR